jgi:hypothetical protein
MSPPFRITRIIHIAPHALYTRPSYSGQIILGKFRLIYHSRQIKLGSDPPPPLKKFTSTLIYSDSNSHIVCSLFPIAQIAQLVDINARGGYHEDSLFDNALHRHGGRRNAPRGSRPMKPTTILGIALILGVRDHTL